MNILKSLLNFFRNEVLSSVVSGIFLSLIYFIFSDFFFSPKELTGKWEIETKTLNTSFRPYEGMSISYLGMIHQSSYKIIGNYEKVKEKTIKGNEEHYFSDKKLVSSFAGDYISRYFSSDILSIYINEKGTKRNSSTLYKLKIVSACRLEGEFFSTIADSSGIATWKKKDCK